MHSSIVATMMMVLVVRFFCIGFAFECDSGL